MRSIFFWTYWLGRKAWYSVSLALVPFLVVGFIEILGFMFYLYVVCKFLFLSALSNWHFAVIWLGLRISFWSFSFQDISCVFEQELWLWFNFLEFSVLFIRKHYAKHRLLGQVSIFVPFSPTETDV